jgi:hypothetical protein
MWSESCPSNQQYISHGTTTVMTEWTVITYSPRAISSPDTKLHQTLGQFEQCTQDHVYIYTEHNTFSNASTPNFAVRGDPWLVSPILIQREVHKSSVKILLFSRYVQTHQTQQL